MDNKNIKESIKPNKEEIKIEKESIKSNQIEKVITLRVSNYYSVFLYQSDYDKIKDKFFAVKFDDNYHRTVYDINNKNKTLNDYLGYSNKIKFKNKNDLDFRKENILK